MYIYGFTSLSSTVHLVAARPRTAGFVAGIAVAALLWHHAAAKPTPKPADLRAIESAVLLVK